MKRIFIAVYFICGMYLLGVSQLNLSSLQHDIQSDSKIHETSPLVNSNLRQTLQIENEVLNNKPSKNKYWPYAIHANVGIVNHPSVTVERDLLVHKTKKYNHLFASLGYSHLSFWRDEGDGIEAKIAGQLGILELNAGLWIPTKQVSSVESQYDQVLPALQIGLRTRSKNNRTIVRFGIGYPDGVYFGLGIRFEEFLKS
jgi:hypothetical protein